MNKTRSCLLEMIEHSWFRSMKIIFYSMFQSSLTDDHTFIRKSLFQVQIIVSHMEYARRLNDLVSL